MVVVVVVVPPVPAAPLRAGADKLVEALPEAPAHEAVDDRVEGAVQVGHEGESKLGVLGQATQLRVQEPEGLRHVDDQVGRPAAHEHQDDHHQHFDHLHGEERGREKGFVLYHIRMVGGGR